MASCGTFQDMPTFCPGKSHSYSTAVMVGGGITTPAAPTARHSPQWRRAPGAPELDFNLLVGLTVVLDVSEP